MSLNRYAAKVDSIQEKIVDGLRAKGYRVEIIGRPVDLLVGRLFLHGNFRWWLLEVKTPTKSGKIRKRKDQEAQDQFIRETNTPRVTTLEEALTALK